VQRPEPNSDLGCIVDQPPVFAKPQSSPAAMQAAVVFWFHKAPGAQAQIAATPTTQSLSNQVSGHRLPKTGIFAVSAGDLR